MISLCQRFVSSKERAVLLSILSLALISCGGGGSPAAPSVQFSAPSELASITLGQSIDLTWVSKGATGCVASSSSLAAGNFGGPSGMMREPDSGTATVTPTATGTFTYTLACTGAGGTTSANVSLAVVAQPPAPMVSVSIPAQDGTILLGGAVPVTWQSSNATSCAGSTSSFFAGPFNAQGYTAAGAPMSTSGTNPVTPLGTGSFTYTVTCSGPGGTGTAEASVVVNQDPRAAPISISSPVQGETITLGQSVDVSYVGPGGSVCSAVASDGGGGGFGSNVGTVADTPTMSGQVTYGVTCSLSSGATSFAYAPLVTVLPDFVETGKISTVGLTTNPVLHNFELQPKGLAIAVATSGPVSAGDLLTCNFADAGGHDGQGSTIVGMNPAGTATYLLGPSANLAGCSALAALPDGTLFAAAYTANEVSTLTPAAINAALPSGTIMGPTSIVYLTGGTLYVAAIDLSRPDGGSIYRMTLNGDTVNIGSVEQIITGLCTSGTPEALYGPVALAYHGQSDTLYIADTSSGEIIEINEVTFFRAAGQLASTCGGSLPTGLTKVEGTPQQDNIALFGGQGSSWTPVGMTVLPSGNLLVANGDLPLPAGSKTPPANSVIEILPASGAILGTPRQLDTGPPGALSGIVATQDDQGNPIVYFTDNNTHAIMKLSQ